MVTVATIATGALLGKHLQTGFPAQSVHDVVQGGISKSGQRSKHAGIAAEADGAVGREVYDQGTQFFIGFLAGAGGQEFLIRSVGRHVAHQFVPVRLHQLVFSPWFRGRWRFSNLLFFFSPAQSAPGFDGRPAKNLSEFKLGVVQPPPPLARTPVRRNPRYTTPSVNPDL